jgi:hypothetical protein
MIEAEPPDNHTVPSVVLPSLKVMAPDTSIRGNADCESARLANTRWAAGWAGSQNPALCLSLEAKLDYFFLPLPVLLEVPLLDEVISFIMMSPPAAPFVPLRDNGVVFGLLPAGNE